MDREPVGPCQREGCLADECWCHCRHCGELESAGHVPDCPEATNLFPASYAPHLAICWRCPTLFADERVMVRVVKQLEATGTPVYVYLCLSCAAQGEPIKETE